MAIDEEGCGVEHDHTRSRQRTDPLVDLADRRPDLVGVERSERQRNLAQRDDRGEDDRDSYPGGLLDDPLDILGTILDDLTSVLAQQRNQLEIVDADLDHDDVGMKRNYVAVEPLQGLGRGLPTDPPIDELEAGERLGRGPGASPGIPEEDDPTLIALRSRVARQLLREAAQPERIQTDALGIQILVDEPVHEPRVGPQ